MRALIGITLATGLLVIPATANAHERFDDLILGGVAGAIVGGPVGAIAGGAIGYTAGPRISHGLGFRHYHHVRHWKHKKKHRYYAS